MTDHLSTLHRFQIIPSSDPSSNLQVLYNSRHTVDAHIVNIRKSGSINGFSFGQKRDPCKSFFRKVMSVFSAATNSSGAGNVNIGVTISVNTPGLPSAKDENHPSAIKSLWTKTNASMFARLDPESLEPIGFAR